VILSAALLFLFACRSAGTRYLVISEATHFEIQGNGQALNLPVFAGTLGIDVIVRNVTTAEYYYQKLSSVYEFKSFTFVNTASNEILLDRAGDLHQPQSVYSFNDSTAKIDLSLVGFQNQTAVYIFRISDKQTGQTRDHRVEVPAGKSASIGALFDRENNRGYLISISTECLDITKELTPARLSEFLLQKNISRGENAPHFFKPGDQRWMDELFGERALKLPLKLLKPAIKVTDTSYQEPNSLEDIPDQKEGFVPVDKIPSPIGFIQVPKYPETAKKDSLQGMVYVEVYIGKDGSVGKINVKKSLREDLDNAAMDAVRNTEWSPAEQKGVPIGAWVVIPFRFVLRN